MNNFFRGRGKRFRFAANDGIHSPGMSGREVCDKIRCDPNMKNLKVAFLTVAKFSDTGKEILTKMKVLDYITKPFDNADLVARVKKLVK